VNGGQTFLSVAVAIGLTCVVCVAVIVIAKFRRGRVGSRARAMGVPHRRVAVAMTRVQEQPGQAEAAWRSVPARIWTDPCPILVAVLAKLAGIRAERLGEPMGSHAQIDRASRTLTSRFAAGPAPGVIGEPSAPSGVLPAPRTHHGQIGPALQIGLAGEDPDVSPRWRLHRWWGSPRADGQVWGTMTGPGFGHGFPVCPTVSGNV
jgi:hypothetical protein